MTWPNQMSEQEQGQLDRTLLALMIDPSILIRVQDIETGDFTSPYTGSPERIRMATAKGMSTMWHISRKERGYMSRIGEITLLHGSLEHLIAVHGAANRECRQFLQRLGRCNHQHPTISPSVAVS